MQLHWARAWAVARKDLLDLRKNKGLLASMMALPLVLVIVPCGVVWAYARSADPVYMRSMVLYFEPNFAQNANPARFLVDKTLTDWFGLYLIMPLFVPILISSHSVAGEKERRTIEPLLATPLTSIEIFLGKSIASIVPAIAVTIFAYLLLCVGVDFVAWPLARALLLPNALWSFGVLIIAPLFAFFGNGVAVLVSARVGETRLAQQFSGLVTLPILGLVGGQAAGLLRSGIKYYGIEGAVILLLDIFLAVASIRLFDRERLISRWT